MPGADLYWRREDSTVCNTNSSRSVRFVELYGADRLLFGSDMSDLPVGWGLGHIMYARISEADKRKILGENLQRLMARYAIQPRG
jgi:predicted TIM-barrel fold metal-dependent hydrolase